MQSYNRNCLQGLALITLCFATYATAFIQVSLGQDDDVAEPKSSSQNTTLFGRIFSPGSASSAKSRSHRPETTTTNNGFFVPLKSLTKGFRTKSDVVDSDDLESRASQTVLPRVPREPFQNARSRRADRRDDLSDFKIEKYINEPTSSRESLPSPVTGRTSVPSPNGKITAKLSESDEALSTTSISLPEVKSVIKPNHGPRSNLDRESESSATIGFADLSSTTRRTTGSNSSTQDVEPGNVRIANTPRPSNETKVGTKNLLDIAGNATTDSVDQKPTSGTNSRQSNSAYQQESSPTSARLVKSTKEIDSSRSSSNSSQASSTDASVLLTTPQVQLNVRGPSAILVGQNTPYEVLVTNEGNDPINGLMIRVAVPKEVVVGDVAVTDGQFQPDPNEAGNAIVWELEHVPSKTTKIARMMLKTTSPEHFAMGIEWTVMPQSGQMPIKVQQPQLLLALEGPSEVDYGKPHVYRLRVRNPGNADVKAVNVELTADQYGSSQSEIGDIPAGSERMVEVELTFEHAGMLPIRAKASSRTANLEASSNIDVNVRQASLVAEWQGPVDFYQGSTAEYELTIVNQGTISAVNNACRVRLPVGVDIVSLPPGVARSGDQLRWDVKRLDPQERATYTFRLLMNKLGANSIEFSVESTTGENVQSSIMTQVDAIADLHLSVTDPVAPAPVGKAVTYEITISNRGKKAAEDVFVIAQFSDGIEPLRLEGQPGKIVPGQALFDVISSIGPNEKVTIKIVAEASKPGVHRFRAAVKCQGSDDDLLEEESTRYTASNAKSDRR